MKIKVIKFIIRGLTIGGAFILGFGVVLLAVLAFSEPASGPSITEPTTLASEGSFIDIIGTPNSITATTTTLFGYLRTVFTDIGMTPSLYTEASSNDGSVTDLLGTAGALSADGQTVLNYLKNINDNLDFPDTASVLNSDTVKGVAGNLATGTISLTTTTQSAAYYEAFDLANLETDLAPGNIINGVTIFGITGTWSVVYCDNDSDGYYSSNPTLTEGQCTGGMATSTPGTDCDDTDAGKYTSITAYIDSDSDGYGAGTGYSFCTSGSVPSGYSLNSTDCAVADATKWQYLTGYTDADSDTYAIGSAQQVCSGNSLPSGYVASSAGIDCMDSNANVYPGQTTYYGIERGDGSFDYNCDGTETKDPRYDCYYGSNNNNNTNTCYVLTQGQSSDLGAPTYLGYANSAEANNCGYNGSYQFVVVYAGNNSCVTGFTTTYYCTYLVQPIYTCISDNNCSYKWYVNNINMPCR